MQKLLAGTALHGAVFGLLALGAPAAAQTVATTNQTPAAQRAETVVVVTGSNIAAATDSGAIAVSVIRRDQIESLGQASTGELLENLAQAGSFEINGAADGPNDARGDIATVNLRGLGTGNTLVLLNGRRIAAHAVNQDIGSTPRQVTNVNAFPSAGVDRFEVLRDGASALYGADATAGVVNTILTPRLDGTRATVRGSRLDGVDHGEFGVDLAHGFEFNRGATRVTLVGSYFTRNPLYASDLSGQFTSVDKRAFLGDSPWATATTDFRNTSNASPFGEFIVGSVRNGNQFIGQRVRRGTTALTSTGGIFHLQPCSFPGTLQTVTTTSPDGCMGIDDNTLDTGLRFDFNANQPNNSLNQGFNIQVDPEQAKGRQLITEVKRWNAYMTLEHDISDTLEAFGEFLFYKAGTDSARATQPMDSGLAFLIVPAANFWNPFGPTTSPNRIAGLNTADIPAAGLDVLVQQWRPTELDWDWESAVGVSANETTDVEGNRISKTLLQRELSKSTPDAINPFGGSNANTAATWDRVRISSKNRGETTLITWDARFTHDSLFKTWAGDVGAAFGGEFRRETYVEDRDPRLDGTIIFNTLNVSGRSDVVGVSPTADSTGARNVYSAFGEVLVPLNRGTGTFVNDLTLQIAVRAEHFDDLGDGAIKPKVALSWFPVEFLNLRAAWSQGFRVPNLVQLNRGDISRLSLGVDDYWRAPVTLDAQSNGDAYVASVRQANPNLRNEDTETIVLGVIADLDRAFTADWLKDLRFSVDYWKFEQTDLIGAFGDQEALALDFLERRAGRTNPNVVRAAVTPEDIAAFDAWNRANPNDRRTPAGQVQFIIDPFINLDSQVADGFDFAAAARFDLGGFGELDIDFESTWLRRLDVVRNELLQALSNDPTFTGAFDVLAVDRIKLDGNPEWRSSASVRWSKGRLAAGFSVRYISEYSDISADLDQNADGIPEYWLVEAATRVNAYVEARLGRRGNTTRVRFGINNLFDTQPPLVDDALGYDPEYHWLKGREFTLQVRASF
jgi:iron complex outermembrane recepter protein